MRRGLALLLAAAGTIPAGCGYHLQGRTNFLPESVRIIAVLPFENRTSRPEIEQRITEAVARELAKRGRYRVVTSVEGADAVLEGAVTEFRAEPVQFNAEGRMTRVETVVVLQATLREVATDLVLWSQSGMVFREQYDVPEEEAQFFDPQATGANLAGIRAGGALAQETLALDEIARGAAGALVTSVLEGF